MEKRKKNAIFMTIFDILRDIVEVKSGKLDIDPEFNKSWSNFMIARWLSMDGRFLDYANFVNRYQCTFNSIQMYHCLTKMIPKQKLGYVKYIKKSKEN